MRYGVHALFGLLLVVGIARGVPVSPNPIPLTVTAIALGCWYAYGVAAAHAPLNTVRSRLWFLVLLGLWAAAAAQSVEFGWLAFLLLLIVVPLFPAAATAVIAVVVTGIVVATQVGSGTTAPGAVLGPVIGALVAIGTAAGYRRIVAESEDRRRLVAELMAAQDDLVIVNEELARAQRSEGVLAERARLARDIHDTLAQGFSSVVLLARAAAASPERTAELLATIEQTASDNLADARRVVQDLAPAELQHTGLPGALGRLVERFTAQTGLRTELHLVGDPAPTPTGHDTALLRVAQSALSNVRLHAGATRVDVTLGYDHGVSLDVVDDGRGFNPDSLGPPGLDGGFGLRAMAARLADLGGTFSVESAPGEGTAVAARFDS